MAETRDRIRIERTEARASGRGGSLFGDAMSWVEERYPDDSSQTCAVLRMKVDGASKVVAYITPDGQFHTVGV